MRAPRRERPEGCLSDFAFDRRLAGELDPREEAEARVHLAGCARCTERFEALSREREAFAKEPLPLFFGARSEKREARSEKREAASGEKPLTMKSRFVALAGVLAAAAVLFLFFRTRPLEETRTKGDDVKLGFYVKHGDGVRLGGQGERVAPGDALRFVYTARTASYLAVLSIDGARRASVYYPRGATAAAAPAGVDVALPESTVLDATLGDETIYGIFCAEPFAVEPLRAALEASPDRAPSRALSRDGCVTSSLPLRKETIREP